MAIAAFGPGAEAPIALTVFGVLSALVTVSVAVMPGWWPTVSSVAMARTRAGS